MKLIAVFALLVAAACAAAPLLHADAKLAIPNEYIIVLKSATDLIIRDAHMSALRASAGAEVFEGFAIQDLVGYSARLTPALLKKTLEDPLVEYVEQNQVMSILSVVEPENEDAVVTQTGATWGLDRCDQQNLPLDGRYVYTSTAGELSDAFVVDTGILLTHVDFAGRAFFGYSAITGEANNDLNGHGTHCAGTIAGTTWGIAKKANLYAVKVLSGSGSGTTAGVINGVNYVANNKKSGRACVANMSLGGGVSTTLDSAVANAISAGCTFAVAAGNDNANSCNGSPARVATAITVGATANNDARSTFSSFGTCNTCFAPGTSITSTWIGSNTATNTISGTSMATPHVAGAACLRGTSAPGSTPASIKTWIVDNGTKNKVTNPGTGSPNVLLYTAPQ